MNEDWREKEGRKDRWIKYGVECGMEECKKGKMDELDRRIDG